MHRDASRRKSWPTGYTLRGYLGIGYPEEGQKEPSMAAASRRVSGKKVRPRPPGASADGFAIRSRIVGKAAGVFGRLGAADTTVEDILQAADVSRRTFYRFFQSKEDVLDALHEIGCNMLIGAARQAASMPGDPLTRLAHAIEGYLEYHVTVGTNVMYVVQGESMRAGSKLGPRRRAFLDTMVEISGKEMEKATGIRVDPLLLRSLLVAIESVSLMLKSESDDGQFDLERAKRVMLRIVLASIALPNTAVPPVPVLPPTAKRVRTTVRGR